MIIYLFLENKLLHFLLPKITLGSFSFDENEDEEDKLINIESKEDNWYIYSTSEVKILDNNSIVDKLMLEVGKFYKIRKNEIDYLIYVDNPNARDIKFYSYNGFFNLTIGNDKNCNVCVNNQMFSNLSARIYLENGKCFIEKKGNNIYNNYLTIHGEKQEISYGSQINVFYLKIIILSDIIIVFSDKYIDLSNILNSNLTEYIPTQDEFQDIEIKDINLYAKGDYYFKSPRLRRFIKTKEIKFSKPPSGKPDEELPAILTIGPIFTMGIVSFVNLATTLSNILSKKTNLSTEWPKLFITGAMLLSMIMWPLLIRWYTKRLNKKKRKKLEEKYAKYLSERREELVLEANYQSAVLYENLISTSECLNIISKKSYNFWDKRRDQDDFLQVRLGLGTEKLNVDIKYSEEDFTVEEDELKQQADKVVQDFKNIYNVPIKYSFYENKITAIIGDKNKCQAFFNNILLQLITFYTYEDLKFVVFTNEKNKDNWMYLKYINHSFSNSKNIRFFSSDVDSAKKVSDYLQTIVNQRVNNKDNSSKKLMPYFILIVDDYNQIKSFDFIKQITETEEEIGFSIILLEDRLSELPSKCNNFISIVKNSKCEVIRNSIDIQEHLEFVEEIVYDIDMMKIAREVSNIPIEFETDIDELPDSISFLAMEKVGKIEQLNILNRWNTNDSTISLKTEIGIDKNGNLIYLDLHEKMHGPHGLIAGTTGSGKSEFIITYILSLCMNFSPDIVSFVIIDYKGGGLALAFENKITGVVLPHLAGTITNLDKAEMDRTLVSIDSEIKRRQKLFNEARENLNESTIDIYKYQKYYKEGKLNEPVPHLFIICDEFAELKSQQPEFMDNLISVARIGRSLGVHLILATQKPSGVVNDQIWSNSKFKVCLKVQDESDSREMLKKTDAAYLKQAGRFYLQVGYDELYMLGQSGWCGAKYFPSDKIVKEVDKSINFINDSGEFIKSIQFASSNKIEADGDQFSAILNKILETSIKINKKSRKLWLDNIPDVILIDDLKIKYNIESIPYNVEAILGEYDAPEIQYQNIVKYNFLHDGNTIIYGNNSIENEMLLNAMIYSTSKYHKAEEVNFYILDYGSESLKKYEKLAHVGGIVVASDDEKYSNLIKFLKDEIKRRKQLFSDFGGEYKNYIKHNKLPLIVVMLNNYDSIMETNKDFYEIIPDLIRDSNRYGIIFVITCNTINSINNKVSSNCQNVYAFKLKDQSDYMSVFGMKVNNSLRDIMGRGFIKNDIVHEFQVANICDDNHDFNDIIYLINKINELNSFKAQAIPLLPNKVTYDLVKDKINNINNVPIGISKDNLTIETFNFRNDIGNIISANRLINSEFFVKSLIKNLSLINDFEVFVIDPMSKLCFNDDCLKNYFTSNMEDILNKLNLYLDKLNDEDIIFNGTIIIYGLDKFISEINNSQNFYSLLQKIKKYEKINVIIVDEVLKIKNHMFETWFKLIFNINNGIWLGKGISNQSLFHLTAISKEMSKDIDNDMGYIINESSTTLCKFINYFDSNEGEENGK